LACKPKLPFEIYAPSTIPASNKELPMAAYVQCVDIVPNDRVRGPKIEDNLFRADLSVFRLQMNAAMSRFLEIELKIGQTFADAAINSRWTQELLHNRRLARRAYDTTVRLRDHANLAKADARRVDSELQRLKWKLSQLGDPT
jgi:hypothetical protein